MSFVIYVQVSVFLPFENRLFNEASSFLIEYTFYLKKASVFMNEFSNQTFNE